MVRIRGARTWLGLFPRRRLQSGPRLLAPSRKRALPSRLRWTRVVPSEGSAALMISSTRCAAAPRGCVSLCRTRPRRGGLPPDRLRPPWPSSPKAGLCPWSSLPRAGAARPTSTVRQRRGSQEPSLAPPSPWCRRSVPTSCDVVDATVADVRGGYAVCGGQYWSPRTVNRFERICRASGPEAHRTWGLLVDREAARLQTAAGTSSRPRSGRSRPWRRRPGMVGTEHQPPLEAALSTSASRVIATGGSTVMSG